MHKITKSFSQSLLGQNQYIDTPQYTGYSPSTPGMGGTNYVTDTGVGVTQDLSQVAGMCCVFASRKASPIICSNLKISFLGKYSVGNTSP